MYTCIIRLKLPVVTRLMQNSCNELSTPVVAKRIRKQRKIIHIR